MLPFLFVIMIAYLAGSVNFSILMFKAFRKGDPRERASGNPGVVNVYRQAGIAWAGMVLMADTLRACGVACLALWFCPLAYLPWCALSLLVGNRYPLFHGFHGGKGVANYLGFTVMVVPWAAALAAVVWVVIHQITRRPFLGSFGMITVLSIGLSFRSGYHPSAVLGTIVNTIFVVYAHRTNIRNLLSPDKPDS
jgi:glycerol-3-phosphate acyltransferase PlsY